jgi:hypothetical protein
MAPAVPTSARAGHNAVVTPATIELVERVTRRLAQADKALLAAAPATDAAIDAAEVALGCTFPPSYKAFLRRVGGIDLPPHLAIVHHFVGVEPLAPDRGVVEHTLAARDQRRLGGHLIVVGMGAQFQEWFCLDTGQASDEGECPVVLFDARDNAVDQQFYGSFEQMLREVFGFVDETLSNPPD